ncbi:MAG TPA: glycosyltransferase, partial [Thermoanaerobaculia bacterium]|nr:glycosyltransferase [Thermoanaerobaculia bacterium]
MPPASGLSIVVPVFNEEAVLRHTHAALSRLADAPELAELPWVELVYVDDGSSDGSARVLRELAGDSGRLRVRALQFSRNFGHSAAVIAGLEAARGGYVAIIDADLQDPPEVLPAMYREL